MAVEQEIVLTDRNGGERACIPDGLETKHQLLITDPAASRQY